jgi:hypothetical protein
LVFEILSDINEKSPELLFVDVVNGNFVFGVAAGFCCIESLQQTLLAGINHFHLFAHILQSSENLGQRYVSVVLTVDSFEQQFSSFLLSFRRPDWQTILYVIPVDFRYQYRVYLLVCLLFYAVFCFWLLLILLWT